MPRAKKLPDKDELWRLLSYDRKTGRLTWNWRTPQMLTETTRSREHACAQWNSRYAGKEAFTKINVGYRCGSLLNQAVLAHRVIWKMVTGKEADEIDHIDGNRANNAWVNLRSVPASLNRRNACLRSDNKSGCPGVFFNTRRGKWQAGMLVDGRQIHIGFYATKEEAIKERKWAEVNYGFHDNHGREAATEDSNPAA